MRSDAHAITFFYEHTTISDFEKASESVCVPAILIYKHNAYQHLPTSIKCYKKKTMAYIK